MASGGRATPHSYPTLASHFDNILEKKRYLPSQIRITKNINEKLQNSEYILINQAKDIILKKIQIVDATSGASMDWAYEQNITISYTFELRDNGM